jgi:sterol 24-C-methyltransferase
MSDTKGSLFGLLKKAATGKGVGQESCNDATIASHAKFMHSMYQTDEKQNSAEEEAEQHAIRQKNAQSFVDSFYTIVTDFYESGWGQSFHFAPRGKSETFRESIVRHEHYLAMRMQISEDDYCLDMGCGIGGPMRNIHLFTGARIVGITINDYQIRRGNTINAEQGMDDKCVLKVMDYCNMTFENDAFDKVFAIESTCHAPSRSDVYREAYRVLKPGGLFASYEWVLNSKFYDDSNAEHVRIRRDVEKGNALPSLITESAMLAHLKDAGFEIMQAFDIDDKSRKLGQSTWFASLEANYSLENIQHTYFGTLATHYLCWAMEKVGLAPKGTLSTHEILLKAKLALIDAGRTQIFTPMFFVIARKPMPSETSQESEL